MTQWQKSSFSSGSDGTNCVELALSPARILLRESDDPARILPVTRDGAAALIRHLGGYASEPKFWVQ
ncbi:DUF397 domain-containing protein [Streptomyces sp. NPDC001868]|uniref:DUF397 domain-containing protein n=1 Tax=Streptomyces sp. NPDC001868 TaxID=3154401 RepID=UPI00332F38C2